MFFLLFDSLGVRSRQAMALLSNTTCNQYTPGASYSTSLDVETHYV